MAHFRDKKTGSILKQEISQIIQNEIKDPRVTGLISVTDVIVTKDLRSANVYISVLGDEQAFKNCIIGIKNAIGFIKRRLGENLRMKYVPDIRIKEDHSISQGSHLYNVLKNMEESSNNEN